MAKTALYPKWTLEPPESPDYVQAAALTEIAEQLSRIADAMERANTLRDPENPDNWS